MMRAHHRRRGAQAVCALLVLGCVAACTPRQSTVPAEPASEASEPVAAVDAPEAAAGAELWGELVPIDRACESDDDCVLNWHTLDGNGRCCGTCSPDAVGHATDVAVRRVCSERDRTHGDCPYKKKCAAHKAVCVERRCRAVRSR